MAEPASKEQEGDRVWRDKVWDALVAKFNEDDGIVAVRACGVDEEDALERLRNTDWENRT